MSIRAAVFAFEVFISRAVQIWAAEKLSAEKTGMPEETHESLRKKY